MTVVVTMAGAGSRFRNQGYQVPKHMIRARGKTLFEWSMESLQDFKDQHFVFACLDEHDAAWIERQAAAMGFRQVSVVSRPSLSLGQAQTAYDAMSKVDLHEAIWIYNIDTYIARGLSPSDMDGSQGCVHVFHSTNPAMSFVRFGDNDHVVELAEKKVISKWATVGVYGFESANLYRQLYEASYQDGRVQEVGGERYVAPMYQLLLNSGGKVSAPKLDLSAVYILGTPGEVLDFDPNVKPPYGS
jgi:NDP-sugar pyrophosphorylase family protein